MGGFWDTVTIDDVGKWILIAILVGYFIYKEWPDLTSRIHKADAKSGDALDERIQKIEGQQEQIDKRLSRDYERLNSMEIEVKNMRDTLGKEIKVMQETGKQTQRELAMILQAQQVLIAHAIDGNNIGELKTAKDDINTYINQRAHGIESEGPMP